MVFQNHFIYLRKKYALMPPMSIILRCDGGRNK